MSLLDQVQLNKSLPVHQDFKKMLQKMKFWEESVEVSEEYYDTLDPNGNPVIKKFTCEELADLQFRKSISSPRGYMGGILQKYLSCSFKVPPVRSDNEFYSNVDLIGSDIDEFMLHKSWEAAVYGASYMMPDSTSSDPSLSEAQKRQIGARSFIRSIETENVVNWIDYLGHLQEVIIVLEEVEGQFALWYDNENMCRIELDSRGKVTSIGDIVPSGYSQMPVVRMLPFDTNESFVAAGCLSQMTLNNLLSLEKTEIFNATYTRFFMKGIRTNSDDDGNIQKISWGTNRLIVSDSETAAITPLGAQVDQAQSIRDSIKGEEESLYRIYHLVNTQIQAGTAPSGYSIVLSREDFNAICATFAKTAERAENTIALLLNETESLGLDTVVYSREFIEPSKQEKILEMRDILSLPIPDDMKSQEIDNFRKMFYNDSE